MKIISAPSRIQWLLPAISIAIGFLFFLRQPSDLLATVQHSMLLVHSVFSGNVFDFYQLSVDHTIMPAMYNLLMYLAMAIPLLPVALVFQAFGGFDYTDELQIAVSLRVTQIVIIALLLLATYQIYKLAKQIGYLENQSRWAAYIFLASPITLFADAIFWQYDIFNVIFLCLALKYYFNHDLTKFSLVMSVAICLKMFAFFIFIPLLLLVEKRFSRIALHFAIGVSLSLLFEFIAKFMPGYEAAKHLRAHIFGKLTDNGIPFAFGLVSLSIIAIVLVTFYAYIKHTSDEADFRWNTLLISTTGFALPFVFFHANPYWWILLMPFLALLVAGHSRINEALVALTGFFVFFIVNTVLVFRFYIDQNLVNGGLIEDIFDIRYSGSPSFASIAESRGLYHPELAYGLAMGLLLGTLALLALKKLHFFGNLSTELAPSSVEVKPSTVILYNLGLYAYIAPTLALFARELLFN